MTLQRTWLVLVSVDGKLRFKDNYETEWQANEMAETVIQALGKEHSIEITMYKNQEEYSVYKRDADEGV